MGDDMHPTLTFALFAIAGVALSGTAYAAGGPGESCFSTRECAPGLKCIDNACGRDVPPGATMKTRPPPVRASGPAAQGESCFSGRDCAEGLKCIDNVCGHDVPPSAMKAGSGPLGAKGETCRARSDCAEGLKCMRSTCVGENASTREDDGGDEWLRFDLHGTHPFVGIGGMAGPAWATVSSPLGSVNDRNVQGSGLFALRGGVIFDNQELAIELSPMTYFPYNRTLSNGPVFQVNGTWGYYAAIYDSAAVSVYWPIRLGVGMFAGGDNTGGLVYFQAIGDLVGPAIRVGHLIFDLRLPSFRYAVTSRSSVTAHIFAWELGASVNYVF
jgi:hypothetical protein